MNPVKRLPFRKIAENQVNIHFGDLDTTVRNELATSLVRQWLANDGYAVLVTSTRHYWFKMIPRDNGCQLAVDKTEANWTRLFSQDWHVDEEAIPGLLHQLNLCQSVLCRTTKGLTLELRIEPKERTVRCEVQPGEEE